MYYCMRRAAISCLSLCRSGTLCTLRVSLYLFKLRCRLFSHTRIHCGHSASIQLMPPLCPCKINTHLVIASETKQSSRLCAHATACDNYLHWIATVVSLPRDDKRWTHRVRSTRATHYGTQLRWLAMTMGKNRFVENFMQNA